MTHPQMYRINAVDRAGTPWAECTLIDPAMVMWKLEQLRAEAKLRGNDRVYWVDDPDDEERGDISIELEEACVEAIGLAEFDRRFVVKRPRFVEQQLKHDAKVILDLMPAIFDRPGYAVNKPEEKPRDVVQLFKELTVPEEASFLRDADADEQIRRRVRQWRFKSMLKRIDWWVIAGWALLACSSVLSTWIAITILEVAR